MGYSSISVNQLVLLWIGLHSTHLALCQDVSNGSKSFQADFPFTISSFFSSVPLVSFQDVSMFEIRELRGNTIVPYEIESPYGIYADEYIPGGYLIADNHAVVGISPDGIATTISGEADESGFGTPERPNFAFINDLKQLDNDSIVVVDTGNNCIRKVDRTTGRADTFAGRCERSGTFEGIVSSLKANFTSPIRALHIKEKNLFYYLIYNPEARIVAHNLTSGNVELMWKSDTLSDVSGIVIDTGHEFIYMTHIYGVSRLSTTDWTVEQVVGTDEWAVNMPEDPIDGSFKVATFKSSRDIAWVLPDQILTIAEANSLRIINLVDQMVHTVCSTTNTSNPVVLGSQYFCQLGRIVSLNGIGNELFIGTNDGRGRNERDYFLRLPYDVPRCNAPPITPTELGSYEPKLDDYSHMQTVKYTCPDGRELKSNKSVLACVRSLTADSVVTGKWDSESFPQCVVKQRSHYSLMDLFVKLLARIFGGH